MAKAKTKDSHLVLDGPFTSLLQEVWLIWVLLMRGFTVLCICSILDTKKEYVRPTLSADSLMTST